MNESGFKIILSMVIFGTIGILRRSIPIPSSMLAMVRGLIGGLFLIGLAFFQRRKIGWKNFGTQGVLIALSGAFMGFNWILLFEAYRYTTVAVATLCYYMAPVIVILLSPIVVREKLTGKKLLCVLIALVGVTMVSGVFSDTHHSDSEMIGVMLALGAAVLYASVVLLNKRISEIDPYDKTVIQLLSAGIVIVPYVLVTENLSSVQLNLNVCVLILIAGILHTGIAYMLYFDGLKGTEAQKAALYSYIDPIVAILASAFILQETVSMLEWIGAILILGSTLLEERISKNV